MTRENEVGMSSHPVVKRLEYDLLVSMCRIQFQVEWIGNTSRACTDNVVYIVISHPDPLIHNLSSRRIPGEPFTTITGASGYKTY